MQALSPEISFAGQFFSEPGATSCPPGAWNREFCSASSSMQPWDSQLTNTVDTLTLVIERMTHDWTCLNAKMRKAHNFKDIEA